MNPRTFGITSIISRKAIKLETSNLVRGFNVTFLVIWSYNVSEKKCGLGHVTPKIFGIPSSISPKPVKPESSKLVHSFIFAPPTKVEYNICERGRGLGHVTIEFLAYLQVYLQNR